MGVNNGNAIMMFGGLRSLRWLPQPLQSQASFGSPSTSASRSSNPMTSSNGSTQMEHMHLVNHSTAITAVAVIVLIAALLAALAL